jgi:hypothetical protein
MNIDTASGEAVRIASEAWNTGRPFNGDMDDVRIYDEALTSAAIRALSGAAVAPMASYNAYDDMDGNNVWENQTAFGRTATSADYALIGDVTRIERPATELLALHGSYAFDGTGDEGRLGGSAENFLTGDITHVPATLEIWFKPDDLLGQEVLWDLGGNVDGSSFTLNNDLLQFIAKSGANDVSTVFDLDVGDDGADYDDFIQAVASVDLDQNELTFFINGTPVATVSATGNMLDWAGGDGVGLGGRHGNNTGGSNGALGNMDGYANFAGQIAVVNVYSSVLDADEVMAAYNAVALPEPGTLALVALGVGLLRRRRRR